MHNLFQTKLSEPLKLACSSLVQICPGLNSNEIHIPHGKHHSVIHDW